MTDKLLNVEEVAVRVSLSRPSIYRLIKKGLFPRQIKIGAAKVVWSEAEIEEFVAARKAARHE